MAAAKKKQERKTGSWVRITYGMPAKRQDGTDVEIRNGSEAKVESFADGVYVCRIGGALYGVEQKHLEANGPRDLQDMFAGLFK